MKKLEMKAFPVKWIILLSAWISGPWATSAQQDRAMIPIDLTGYYTRTIASMPSQELWKEAPDGLNDFQGVPFNCRGILELTGMAGFESNNLRPARISGVPVMERGDVLHLLICTTWTADPGTAIGRMILNYSDGASESVYFAQITHAQRYWGGMDSSEETEGMSPNSKRVWRKNSDRSSSIQLNLFRSTFANPRPHSLVESIDFESCFSQSMPVILGLTLERNRELLETVLASKEKELIKPHGANYGGIAELQLLSKTGGSPISKAKARITARGGEFQFLMGDYRASQSGVIELIYPKESLFGFDLEITARNHVPIKRTLTAEDLGATGPAAPELPVRGERHRIAIEFEEGNLIGGQIQDAEGRPISGAVIHVDSIVKDDSGQYFFAEGFPEISHANGTWTAKAGLNPESFVSVRLEHSDYMRMQYELPPSTGPFTLSRRELHNKDAIMVMLPAPKVVGVVSDDAGRKIKEADVHLADPVSFRALDQLQTDEAGQFEFVLAHEHPVMLVARKEGFAPFAQTFGVQSGMDSLVIVLKEGRTLRSRVVNEKGEPVEGARMRLDSWDGKSFLNWSAVTDREGRIEWDGAPEGELAFSVRHERYEKQTVTMSVQSPAESIPLRRLPLIFGSVTDKDTGEKVQSFSVVPGRVYSSPAGERVSWMRRNQVRGLEGEFQLDPRRIGVGGNSKLLVEAAGYLPVLSEAFSGRSFQELSFELDRGEGPIGKVISPQGDPLRGAVVVSCQEGEMFNFDGGFEGRPGQAARTQTDREGRFELPAKINPLPLIVMHEQGFAEITLEELAERREVVVKPWGRVKGFSMQGERPDAGQTIFLRIHRFSPMDSQSALTSFMQTETDASGQFEFPRVPPGDWEAGRTKIFKMNNYGIYGTSHNQHFDLDVGETADLRIGGEGYDVQGKTRVAEGDGDQISWTRDPHYLNLVVKDLTAPVRPMREDFETQKAYADAVRAFSTAYQEYQLSEAGRKARKAQRQYLLHFEEDGRFSASDIPAGEYNLQIRPASKAETNRPMGRPLGTLIQVLTIPPEGHPENQRQVDLGEFDFKVRTQ